MVHLHTLQAQPLQHGGHGGDGAGYVGRHLCCDRLRCAVLGGCRCQRSAHPLLQLLIGHVQRLLMLMLVAAAAADFVLRRLLLVLLDILQPGAQVARQACRQRSQRHRRTTRHATLKACRRPQRIP